MITSTSIHNWTFMKPDSGEAVSLQSGALLALLVLLNSPESLWNMHPFGMSIDDSSDPTKVRISQGDHQVEVPRWVYDEAKELLSVVQFPCQGDSDFGELDGITSSLLDLKSLVQSTTSGLDITLQGILQSTQLLLEQISNLECSGEQREVLSSIWRELTSLTQIINSRFETLNERVKRGDQSGTALSVLSLMLPPSHRTSTI